MSHPFPSEPGPIHREVKWIEKHAWIAPQTAATESPTVSREEFLANWFKFLSHFVWATWCAPCVKEMPESEKMRAQLAADNIDLMGLNVDADTQAKVPQFLQKTGVTYPIFLGGVSALEKLYLTDEAIVPLSIVVGPDGVVRELISGWSA